MHKAILTSEKIGNSLCALLGLAFVAAIVVALAWGSYLSYYSVVAKGVRGLDESVTTSVMAKMDVMRPRHNSIEGALFQTVVSECVARAFASEHVYATVGEIAGWHGWRIYTEEEIQLQASMLLASCKQRLKQSLVAYGTTVASASSN